MINEILKDTRNRMDKSIEAVTKELASVRTGKASAHLLDTVKVEAYGATMPLNQLATVTAPEARSLVVQLAIPFVLLPAVFFLLITVH